MDSNEQGETKGKKCGVIMLAREDLMNCLKRLLLSKFTEMQILIYYTILNIRFVRNLKLSTKDRLLKITEFICIEKGSKIVLRGF